MTAAGWTRERLQQLIERGEPESLHLDYKRSAALLEGKMREEITKDVSAFANADGGTLIYGIVEGRDRLPERIDDGLSADQMTAERLEDLILGNTSPRPVGIRVHRVELGDAHAGFVVEVPAATSLAPHQAADRKYYRRYESKNLPMHDHEVRDLMRRASVPSPRLEITGQFSRQLGNLSQILLKINLLNDSLQPMEYGRATVFIDKDTQMIDSTSSWFGGGQTQEDILPGMPEMFHRVETQHLKEHTPVTPELPLRLRNLQIAIPSDRAVFFGWEVRCAGAIAKKFATLQMQGDRVVLAFW